MVSSTKSRLPNWQQTILFSKFFGRKDALQNYILHCMQERNFHNYKSSHNLKGKKKRQIKKRIFKNFNRNNT